MNSYTWEPPLLIKRIVSEKEIPNVKETYTNKLPCGRINIASGEDVCLYEEEEVV